MMFKVLKLILNKKNILLIIVFSCYTVKFDQCQSAFFGTAEVIEISRMLKKV